MCPNTTKDMAIALYDYSIELSLEEFYKKGNAFKQCNNIDEIYILSEDGKTATHAKYVEKEGKRVRVDAKTERNI